MHKLLIHGIDSLAGSNFALALADRYAIVGAARVACHWASCRTLVFDPCDAAALARHFEQESPEAVIYCGPTARSAWDLPHAQPIDSARELNTARNMSQAAAACGARFVLLSTDAVFAGPRMFHDETSLVSAAGAGAELARAVEQAVAGPHTLVVRSHIYGWSPDGVAPSFVEKLYGQLSVGASATVDARRYATPILAADLADLVERALRARLEGIFHITGAERANQHRFAAELAVACGLTGRQVLLAAPAEKAAARPYVEETSLNTRGIRRALETPLPMLREGLSRFAAQAAAAREDELSAYRLPIVEHAHAA